MRIGSLMFLFVLGWSGVAQAEHRTASERAPSMERGLSLADIDAKLKPVSAAISKCYLDAAADVRGAGHLNIQLSIHRRGKLDSVSVSTPGLPAKLARKIESCVRVLVEPLEFPVRRTPTTAVIPFYFQHTAAPNTGPQLSCWNPRGCPGQ